MWIKPDPANQSVRVDVRDSEGSLKAADPGEAGGGYGLYILRTRIDILRTRIDEFGERYKIKSTPGCGTCVTLDAPLDCVSASHPGMTAAGAGAVPRVWAR